MSSLLLLTSQEISPSSLVDCYTLKWVLCNLMNYTRATSVASDCAIRCTLMTYCLICGYLFEFLAIKGVWQLKKEFLSHLNVRLYLLFHMCDIFSVFEMVYILSSFTCNLSAMILLLLKLASSYMYPVSVWTVGRTVLKTQHEKPVATGVVRCWCRKPTLNEWHRCVPHECSSSSFWPMFWRSITDCILYRHYIRRIRIDEADEHMAAIVTVACSSLSV